MLLSKKGRLLFNKPELPPKCDICGKSRNLKVHKRCSRIRQIDHEQMLIDEAAERMMAIVEKR